MQRSGSTRLAVLKASAVHLLTASGVVLALLALQAVVRGARVEALAWLFGALVVDGIDGSLARAAKVRDHVPRIDGEALDLIIDYLTYVFIPALFLLHGGYLLAVLEIPLVAAILVSSLYVFARRDMKTDDGYFRGFPALWNIVAFYLFVTNPHPALSALIVAGLVAMTFAPVHFVHPFRVRDYGIILPAAAAIWAVATVALLLPVEGIFRITLLTVSCAVALLLVGMGLLRSVRGARSVQ